MEKAIIVGAGLSGAVVARYLAEKGIDVSIYERRNHIAGNMYDYKDDHGYLVQKYGPHTFHTNKKELYDFMCCYENWKDYKVTCGAVWDGKYTPTPFNFTTIDTFFEKEKASKLKKHIKASFGERKTATVVEVLQNEDPLVRQYAEYLFKNDYAPYTAKQWGISAQEIDPSVLKRVPLRFFYEVGYFDDIYQVMPIHSYSHFFENLLNHPNIHITLGVDALDHLSIKQKNIFWDGKVFEGKVIYTGPIDELFHHRYGKLPYRSLRFEWIYTNKDNFQPAPIVAYPQEKGYTRITEYKKLPVQKGKGSSYAVEYPLPYEEGKKMEPYYPVLTKESQAQYKKYKALADKIPNLICCGRLADFKYYNMDQALERALNVCKSL